MKTTVEIEDDIFTILKGSELARTVSGKIYKGYRRPADSTKEDITVHVLANQNGEVQLAFVNVNIYVKDTLIGDAYDTDKVRTRTLAALACKIFEYTGSGKNFDTIVEEQNIYEADGTKQPEHFINIKVKYRTYNP